MIRFPVVTQDPVNVRPVVPTVRDAILARHSVNVPYNVITWLAPPPNETWEILVYQAELNCSADVGSREIYQYIEDRYGNTMRFLMFKSAAGFINKYVGLPLNAGPSATVGPGDGAPMVSGDERTFVGPAYVQELEHPCRIGILRTKLNSATDVCTFHLLVKERVKL